ncbi:hypothetical protein P9112_000146 [Eukaryota sp. TZLM1-RC]
MRVASFVFCLPPEDRLTAKDVLQSPCNLTNIDKAKSSYNPWPMERHFGTDMQKKLVNLITAMEKASTIITPLIVASTAKKLMISSGYGNLLKCNGGSIEFTPCWAYSFLKNHMQWSNRKPTTARKLTPVEAKHAAVEMSAIMDAAEDYHPRLVLMMDETMVPWIPVKGKTYAPKNQKKITIQGLGDKRGNTATLTISKAGDLLPLQLIWEGKTQVSVPNYEWPSEVIHSLSPKSEGVSKAAVTKWQNGHSIVEYLRYVVGNYLKRVRAEL